MGSFRHEIEKLFQVTTFALLPSKVACYGAVFIKHKGLIIMYRKLLIGLGATFSALTFAAQERPDLGRVVYNYEGCGSPISVSVMRVGEKSAKDFLVRISGVDTELNDQAMLYKAEDIDTASLKYRIVNKADGATQSMLYFDGSDRHTKLYIPGYAGLYTPEGKLPKDMNYELCFSHGSYDQHEFYRLYEVQNSKK